MIGVFDSGVGGLSALRVLRAAAPQADYLYFADQANLPYGNKTEAALLSLSRAAVHRLTEGGARVVLAACGTVGSLVLPTLTKTCTVPLFGIIDPLAEACARSFQKRGGEILVLGTRATVESGVLAAKIRRLAPHAPLLSLSCPEFVTLAEALPCLSRQEVYRRVSLTLAPFHGRRIGTVALGCTHFSHLFHEIRHLFPRADIIDGAAEGAYAMLRALPPEATRGGGCVHLTTSGDTPLSYPF